MALSRRIKHSLQNELKREKEWEKPAKTWDKGSVLAHASISLEIAILFHGSELIVANYQMQCQTIVLWPCFWWSKDHIFLIMTLHFLPCFTVPSKLPGSLFLRKKTTLEGECKEIQRKIRRSSYTAVNKTIGGLRTFHPNTRQLRSFFKSHVAQHKVL